MEVKSKLKIILRQNCAPSGIPETGRGSLCRRVRIRGDDHGI